MPLDEFDRDYLTDMRAFAWEVQSFVAGLRFEVWMGVTQLVRATERSLELLGEAANRVSPELQQSHPEIPFRKMVGLRNVLAHEYGAVKLEILWETATEDLPQLIDYIGTLLSAG